MGGPYQRLAARAIAVGELHRLAIARREPVALCLLQRIGAAVDVLEPVDERAAQTEKRIGPVRTQLRRLAERRHRLGEFLLRLDRFPPRFPRLAVDPMELALAVAQRRSQPLVARR